jgi:pimeloyl-ACP methyl ester carboxylesterase
MAIGTRADLFAGDGKLLGWDVEQKCENQREPGIQDVVWAAIMENDELGRTWGSPPAGAPEGSAPEGLMRARQSVNAIRVWNAEVAAKITAPTLILRGEHDTGQGGLQHVAQLYDLIQNENKLRFTVQCAGHFLPWENQRHVLHEISKQWFKHLRVSDFSSGEFFVDIAGNVIPQ